jgi:tetratricopeptide (TPR) repeat protein
MICTCILKRAFEYPTHCSEYNAGSEKKFSRQPRLHCEESTPVLTEPMVWANLEGVGRPREQSMEPGNAAGVTSDGNRKKLRSSAGALLGRGRLDEARAAYREILERDSTDIQAMLALGRIERRLGNDRAACNTLRAASAIDPNNLQVLTELAAVLRELNRPEEATSIYRTILARDGEHVASHMGLGSMARASHNDEAALTHFTVAAECLGAAAETDPENLQILAQLAGALRELDRPEEATSIYQKILARDREHLQSHMGLGWIARRRGDDADALVHFGAAAEFFKAAAERSPSDLQAQINLAKVLVLMHRMEEAEAIYQRVITQAPNHGQVRAALGALARARHDWGGALEQFSAALETDPKNVQLRVDLGRTFCDLSRLEDAEQTYRSILEDSPGNVEAMLGLAETALARGDTGAALTLFEDAAAAAPLDLRPKQEIRRLRMAQGGYDWRTEVEEAVAAARSTSAPPQTQIEAARILVEYGLTEAARPLLSRLEARFPAARKLLLAVRQIERMGLAQPLSESSAHPDPAENQLNSLRGFIEMPIPNSDTLLIVFGGNGNRLSMTFSLMHKLLRKTGVSIIYCRDLQEEYYTRGVVGLGDFQATVDGFGALATRYGAKRILTLGNCAGCEGALRFGLSLGAQGVLGLSPKFQQEDSLTLQQRTRHRALLEHLTAHHQEVHIQYLEAAVRPKVTLIFGEQCTADAASAHTMAEVPGVTLAGIPGSADADSVKDLLVRGLLEPLLHDFVAKGAVSPELHALISTSGNPQYSH